MAKTGEVFFQMRDAVSVGGNCSSACLRQWLGLERFDIVRQTRTARQLDNARQKMHVARLLGAGLARQNFDERRLAFHQVLQAGLHGVEIVERMHAFGASAEFAGSLRATQQQNAEDSDFVAIEIESFLEAVFVLGDAAVRGADGADQGLSIERMQGLANGGFVEIRDGLAIRFLVAGVEEGVQGERIVFGSGDFFFDEGAEDAALDFAEQDVHGVE